MSACLSVCLSIYVQMLMDPMGGIVMTNDGNAILREVHKRVCVCVCVSEYCVACVCQQIQVQHPAAKSMIEISRTQDEEVGDGTTSVIILGKQQISHCSALGLFTLDLCCTSWRDVVCC